MSTFIVDNLKGKTTANTMTVFAGHATDSTTTTNLEQGLAKQWAYVDGLATPTLQNSLNVSSVSDLTTAEVGYNCTNNFNDLHYSQTFSGRESSFVLTMQEVETSSTYYRLTNRTYNKSHTTSSASDIAARSHTVHGDLA